MSKKISPQTEKQHQQLLDVFSVVGASRFGHYLGFDKVTKKKLNNFEQAHMVLAQSSEVLAYSQFVELIHGIAGGDDRTQASELFLRPNLMTTEPIAGICTLELSRTKCLPLTQRQLTAMRVHRQEKFDEICNNLNVKNPHARLYFYNNPVVNVLTQNRVWLTGIDSFLSRPAKTPFWRKNSPDPQPVLTRFNLEERQLANYIRLYKQAVESQPETEVIYAQPYHFSDVGHALRTEYNRNVRLAELAPDLKAVMMDVTAYISHQAGVRHFLQSHQAHVYTHMYRSEGMFGHCASHDTHAPTVVEPVLDGGVFYEFIPVSHFNPVKGAVRSDHQRLSVENVQENKKYVVVVSTIAGLVGFNTRTIVRVVQKDPLLFEVIGQIGALDYAGQMLTNEETDKMVAKLNDTIVKPYQFYVRHYMVGEHKQQEKLFWVIELSRPPKTVGVQILRGMSNSIHSSLAKENRDYRRTYEQPDVPPPVFVFVPPGSFLAANQSGAKRFDYSDDSHVVHKLMDDAGDAKVTVRATRLGADAF